MALPKVSDVKTCCFTSHKCKRGTKVLIVRSDELTYYNGATYRSDKSRRKGEGSTASVSKTTIQRMFLCVGLRIRRMGTVHLLTIVHLRKRPKFARQYRYWTCSDWQKVAFSDESPPPFFPVDRWTYGENLQKRNTFQTFINSIS